MDSRNRRIQLRHKTCEDLILFGRNIAVAIPIKWSSNGYCQRLNSATAMLLEVPVHWKRKNAFNKLF